MSQFDKTYGGKWLKAGDLDGRQRELQIDDARWEEVGKEREKKLVLGFIDEDKRCILNTTNARRLADKWGKSEASWCGKWLQLAAVETSFGPGLQLNPIESPTVASNVDVPF